jgi:hypothetical protein
MIAPAIRRGGMLVQGIAQIDTAPLNRVRQYTKLNSSRARDASVLWCFLVPNEASQTQK